MSTEVNKELDLTFSEPKPELGFQVWELIKSCPPLDQNSLYCNLLQSDHFANTACAVTNTEGELVGFISGYIPPQKSDTLFIWQVAVSKKARGQNMGFRMMQNILLRDACSNVRYLETTVTEDNKASDAMFQKLANQLDVPAIDKKVYFEKEIHFSNQHDSEILYRIGPFQRKKLINEV
jgi:L-2,4-diaminobutyric acid acetyltransferase